MMSTATIGTLILLTVIASILRKILSYLLTNWMYVSLLFITRYFTFIQSYSTFCTVTD